jgi:hypothetical protein
LPGFRSTAPFVIQPPKPSQSLKKFIAKGGFEPGEILLFRRPIAAAVQLATALTANFAPLAFGLRRVDAPADEITTLNGERQMAAQFGGCGSAEGTLPLT